MSKTTIKDVAKASGYSISTVSNAINNVDVITPSTKEHILKVAKELNYVPNINGKLLKAKESKMIGFFTSSISGPYFYKLVETMAKEAEINGYGLNIFVTTNRKKLMDNIIGGNVDGVIIFEDQWVDEEVISVLEGTSKKCVFLDRSIEAETMTSITFDSFKAGYEATKYLLNLGNRKIIFVDGIESMYDNLQRKQGYEAAMAEAGFQLTEDDFIQGLFEENASYIATKAYLHNPNFVRPDAFLASNDLSAIGTIKGIQSEGMAVPADIQVMGFDDIDIAEYFQPPLTTVWNPIARQGVLAVESLLKMLQGEAAPAMTKLEGKLVVRQSTQFSGK
ncbi:LacI family DNA-binding transcriptional regulator [Vagococcus salmoninarum]|uniref:LacI family transcriptional regulator n=1 Tax=Vagococcus salmoninarum TaxID=2739 RepID=A0A429ZQQ6_9ENTE|nr:LacI family DNA-binding transcriptional regulator [Vagococcus salmoninarum]RST96032.1 LacI family transcriptional regulator [Vagococcus salmoninarum]